MIPFLKNIFPLPQACTSIYFWKDGLGKELRPYGICGFLFWGIIYFS